MTGEITLRGKVLPVGGLREKILAAHRAGLKTVILPEKNMKDLVELPRKVRQDLNIRPVSRMEQVLELALSPKPEKPAKPKRTTKKTKEKAASEQAVEPAGE